MRNIRQTLNDCLFVQSPPFMAVELREYESDVFPGKQDFLTFLKETDSQKRIEIAKRILLRLGVESKLLLPPQLLTNLLRVEEQLIKKPTTYIPRDHYVHLINLYLLGVYIYCYHKNLHHIVTRFFKRLRRKHPLPQSNLSNEVAFLDFIFSWRAFVLLHDVGYIWECPLADTDHLLKATRGFWHRLPNLMATEMASQYLARVATWRFADKEHEGITLEEARANKVFNLGSAPFEEFAFMGQPANRWEDFRTYVRLPLIHGTRFLNTVRTLVEEKRTIALLVHSRFGDIKCGLFPTSNGQHEVRRVGRFNENSDKTLIKMAFTEGKTPRAGPSHDFEWHFFYPSYPDVQKTFHAGLANEFGAECRPPILEKVCDHLLSVAVLPSMTVVSEGDYRRFEFLLYEKLTQWFADAFDASTGRIRADVTRGNAILGGEERRIGGYLADFIRQIIEEKCQGVRIVGDLNSPRERAKALADEVLREIADLDALCEKFVDWYIETVVTVTEADNQRARTFVALTEVFTKAISPTSFEGTELGLTDRDLLSVKPIADKVDAVLREMKAPSLASLFHEYKAEFLSAGNTTDHGLAAGVCAMRIQTGLASVLKVIEADESLDKAKTADKHLGKVCKLALSLGEKSELEKTSYHLQVLMDHVTAAICLHNIYPKYLHGFQDFRINTNDSPFCYFAMLCDSLQKWDREPRLALGERKLPYKTVSDSYDITIDGDLIRVSEFDFQNDVPARVAFIKEGLEEYLHGAKNLIAIEIGEWKH